VAILKPTDGIRPPVFHSRHTGRATHGPTCRLPARQTQEEVAVGKRRYEEFLKANALPALDYLITAIREAPTAILCLEEDARLCHRSVVAQCAAERASLRVVNL